MNSNQALSSFLEASDYTDIADPFKQFDSKDQRWDNTLAFQTEGSQESGLYSDPPVSVFQKIMTENEHDFSIAPS